MLRNIGLTPVAAWFCSSTIHDDVILVAVLRAGLSKARTAADRRDARARVAGGIWRADRVQARQLHDERRSLTDLAFCPELPAVCFRDPARNAQPQPGAPHLARAGLVHAVKAIKDVFQVFRWYANARVADPDERGI